MMMHALKQEELDETKEVPLGVLFKRQTHIYFDFYMPKFEEM